MCVSSAEHEPIDSVLTFLSGYDTPEYSWVKLTVVSVRLRILFVMLQNTNSDYLEIGWIRVPCVERPRILARAFVAEYGRNPPCLV